MYEYTIFHIQPSLHRYSLHLLRPTNTFFAFTLFLQCSPRGSYLNFKPSRDNILQYFISHPLYKKPCLLRAHLSDSTLFKKKILSSVLYCKEPPSHLEKKKIANFALPFYKTCASTSVGKRK